MYLNTLKSMPLKHWIVSKKSTRPGRPVARRPRSGAVAGDRSANSCGLFFQHNSASITWFVWCMSSKAWLSRRVGVELSMFVVVFVLDTIFAQHHKLMHILSTLHATFEFDGCQPNLFCMYSTAYIIINNSCLAVRVRSGIFNDVELLFHKMFFTYTCKIPLIFASVCIICIFLSRYAQYVDSYGFE